MRLRRFVLVIGGLCLLALVTYRFGGQQPAPPTPIAVPVITLAVLQVADPAPSALVTPPAGSRLVAVRVMIHSTVPIHVNPLSLSLLSTQQRIVPLTLGATPDQLWVSDLPANTSIRGWVAFALDPDEQPASLRYAAPGQAAITAAVPPLPSRAAP